MPGTNDKSTLFSEAILKTTGENLPLLAWDEPGVCCWGWFVSSLFLPTLLEMSLPSSAKLSSPLKLT